MNEVWLGYDRTEDLAYQVCYDSITRYETRYYPMPLVQDFLRAYRIYTRPPDILASTDFSLTRFCVPRLSSGWTLFADCDILFTQPLTELFSLADPRYAVMVVKHDHNPNTVVKMNGKMQLRYPRKNWSSVILWNCDHPANEAIPVNSETPQYLHRFGWLADKDIGSLPLTWNFLVGEYEPPDDDHLPAALHYTEGTPNLPGYENSDYADIWRDHVEQLRIPNENSIRH